MKSYANLFEAIRETINGFNDDDICGIWNCYAGADNVIPMGEYNYFAGRNYNFDEYIKEGFNASDKYFQIDNSHGTVISGGIRDFININAMASYCFDRRTTMGIEELKPLFETTYGVTLKIEFENQSINYTLFTEDGEWLDCGEYEYSDKAEGLYNLLNYLYSENYKVLNIADYADLIDTQEYAELNSYNEDFHSYKAYA